MSTTPTERRPLYPRLWAGVPRELGYLLPLLPIVIVSQVVLAVLFSLGIGLLPIVLGVFVLVGALYTARGAGTFELARLRLAGTPPIRRPSWSSSDDGGFWRRLTRPIIGGHYWLYLLHSVLVVPIVGSLVWSVTIAWLSIALGGTSYWIYSRWIPSERDWNFLDITVGFLFPGSDPSTEQRLADNVFFFIIGVIALVTLPFVTHALTRLQWAIARVMLAAFDSEALQRRVAEVSASRTAAVAAEGTALRRLERDIHDGPQQRLVRLQMDLAAAERQLEGDPDRARELIAEARRQSKDALDELRALSRGFAPPLLLDRGLVAALDSLASRSPLPTTFVDESPAGIDLPDEVQRAAYFVGSEALANAAKHAEASNAEIRVAVRSGEEPASGWLDVIVSDDGRGGASAVEGHGLAGLDERVRGVGGTLEVFSPAGGPTILSAHLPVGIPVAP
ncbi:signal transduction histidine kinase [Diaminobutyricimonas aerilata]|uniref:histidine kinase n=1 Tax=Diaminobutyricimonas aerilata TaxID=1162967 RepID=A0A2M9CJA7_9MICO|nr:sensor histidine kinase [Diaminobutyricimonas aerilata]PJJ71928.1 signal transduction histidine kinase [Diaminobutyricimonas aerilata]